MEDCCRSNVSLIELGYNGGFYVLSYEEHTKEVKNSGRCIRYFIVHELGIK